MASFIINNVRFGGAISSAFLLNGGVLIVWRYSDVRCVRRWCRSVNHLFGWVGEYCLVLQYVPLINTRYLHTIATAGVQECS